MPLSTLIEAINNRKTIRYRYLKPNEPTGERIGHPYAVFIFTSKEGVASTKVHIVQIDGDSKSGKEFPSFRMYNIGDLQEVKILPDMPQFGGPLHELYRPESDMYLNVIAKV